MRNKELDQRVIEAEKVQDDLQDEIDKLELEVKAKGKTIDKLRGVIARLVWAGKLSDDDLIMAGFNDTQDAEK